MFEFQFYLDMTCVATPELENQWFDEKGGDYDEHYERPATGYIVWPSYAAFDAAIDYICTFLPLFVPWQVSNDPDENINSWLRYEQMASTRLQKIEDLWYHYDENADLEYLYLDLPADDLCDEPAVFWIMHIDRDGELPDDGMATDEVIPDNRPVRMANMFWGEDARRDGCMLFTDIVAAVKQKRAEQLHAMLLATKRPRDDPDNPKGKKATALGRATTHWLFDRNVFSVVGDFL